jgi:hypothetical protein
VTGEEVKDPETHPTFGSVSVVHVPGYLWTWCERVAHGPWQWQYENENTREEFRSFEQFLSSHPWIAEKLRKDPTLANNSDFLNDNKELRNFLNAHPFVQADLRQDPCAFMQREQEFERWERERVAASSAANDASVAEFDQFLSNHPWIAKR